MSQHTPGPWLMGEFRYNGPAKGVDIGAADNSNVARAIHESEDRTSRETLANARLIAKAPEMLNLILRGSQVMEETHPGWVKTARALLREIES